MTERAGRDLELPGAGQLPVEAPDPAGVVTEGPAGVVARGAAEGVGLAAEGVARVAAEGVPRAAAEGVGLAAEGVAERAARVVAGDPAEGTVGAAEGVADLAPDAVADLAAEVRELARERKAIILAHHYQRPEVQDVADYVGDSLGLARRAAASGAPVIVFCGVHFMAETAAILCPKATVLLPDLEAGCSLAASVDAEAVRAWKAAHPGAVVVSYVNTMAAVKAESDYCCTSSNARAVIEAIPPDREILFLPDLFLGLWLERVTGRRLHLWPGECHVHAGIRPEDVERITRSEPDASLLVHPECGCTSQALAFANERTHVLSTQGMIEFARRTAARRLHVATETGILYGLRRAAPETEFVPIREDAVCGYMKRITLPKVRDALRDGRPVVTVEPDIAARARLAIERMVAIGG